ncbi:MDR family MFS transporter [Streptacidiphilus sp. N1-12]|uniref:MDR family MFS transporter n=2 Tax=Streptacidiphilus alkalitolerans TaxID=3342712 RepID=A0ABV6WTX5_9ACTN
MPQPHSRASWRYTVAMLVDATGSGMYLPLSLLYFHYVTGLPLPAVGATMTVAALLGVVSNPLAGILVDRYGARTVVIGGYLLRSAGFGGYLLVHNQVEMFLAVVLVAFGDRTFPPSIQALISEIAQGTARDRLIARQKSLRNGGLGIGGLTASVLLGVGHNSSYHLVVGLDSVSFVLAAVLIATVPSVVARTRGAGRPSRKGGYRTVARDRSFVRLTLINAPLALCYMTLSMVLPVYLTQTLRTSTGVPGMLYALNTIGIAVVQIPLTRLVIRRARTRTAALGGAVFALSFLLFASSALLPGQGPLLGCLFLATALYTTGELLHSPATSALATGTAPAELRGRYMAFYQLSWALPSAAAPTLFTAGLALSPTGLWLLLATLASGSALALLRMEHRLPEAAVRPWTRDAVPAAVVPAAVVPAPTTVSPVGSRS